MERRLIWCGSLSDSFATHRASCPVIPLPCNNTLHSAHTHTNTVIHVLHIWIHIHIQIHKQFKTHPIGTLAYWNYRWPLENYQKQFKLQHCSTAALFKHCGSAVFLYYSIALLNFCQRRSFPKSHILTDWLIRRTLTEMLPNSCTVLQYCTIALLQYCSVLQHAWSLHWHFL